MSALRAFPAIVAHRGFWMQYPENTVPAFMEAMRIGADMVELDVHETKDGEFIVFHDAAYSLTTPRWTRLTYMQIRDLVGDIMAPRLVDCVAVIPGMPINISVKRIKHPSQLAKLLNSIHFPKGTFISSPQYFDLRALHRLKTKLPLFLILSWPPQASAKLYVQIASGMRILRFLPTFLSGVSIHHRLISRRLIELLHERNLKVHTWTVNNPKKMQKLIEHGIDGIITNRPDILMDLKKQSLH
jgi:glycerophosphoryl diester phosphodiesterase